jgi:hypothetical protein
MKKILFVLVAVMMVSAGYSQDTTSTKKTVVVANRANDHLMFQIGYAGLTGKPDSFDTKGFSRFFNVYFMLNKPFKTNPHMSVALGVGIGSNNFYTDNVFADIKSRSTRLPLTNVDSADHFKKAKITTIFADVPVELRYLSNPSDPDNSFKFAVGAKVGTLLKAYTKGKDFVNKSGASLYDNKYTVKEYSKKFFNTTKLAVTARVGFGNFTLSGEYQVTSYLKDGAGAVMHPYNVGLTISGL